MFDAPEIADRLAAAVIRWSEMPRGGDAEWESDLVYAAEVMVPLAEEYLQARQVSGHVAFCPSSDGLCPCDDRS